MKKGDKQLIRKIVRKLKKQGRILKQQINGISKINELSHFKNIKKIIYCLVPEHGNMGDQAIAFATLKFLKDNFKDYQVIEFTQGSTYTYIHAIMHMLNEDDLVVLHGGGNMGDLWIHEEEPRRFLISRLKKNPLISMPQTINFSKGSRGNKELRKSLKAYNRNPNLTLLAREHESYRVMKALFPNQQVIEVPDIVFYLEDLFEATSERSWVLTCFRKDKESFYGKATQDLIHELKEAYENLVVSDTTLNRPVPKEKREAELFLIWQEFRSAKVVITDRLHGMIFAVITKTPCIVLRSLDHKVIESYEWVKNLNYIRYAKDLDLDNIRSLIQELSEIDHFDKTTFKADYFDQLAAQLKSLTP